ncbi:hypothetical protein Tco_0385244 [Tanacetum coccineum]
MSLFPDFLAHLPLSQNTDDDEIVIPRKSQKKPPTALAGLFLNKGTKHHVSANEVKAKLIHSKDADIVKQAYALFALGTIICATRRYLAPYYLRYVRDVSAFKKKQWAAHAIYCLVEGIDKYKKAKGSTRHSLRWMYHIFAGFNLYVSIRTSLYVMKKMRVTILKGKLPVSMASLIRERLTIRNEECNDSSKTIMGLSSLDEILDATAGDGGKKHVTRRIIETIHVDFDELTLMASEHSSSGPALHEMTPVTISSGLVPNHPPSTPFVPPSRTDWDILFQPMFDELLTPLPSVDYPATEVVTPIHEVVDPVPAVFYTYHKI